MRQRSDQHHRQGDANRHEQADREQAALKLREVERQGRLEDQARHECDQKNVAADPRKRCAGQQADHDARQGQHHRVGQHPRAPGHEAEQCGQASDEDEQQQESLLSAHEVVTAPRTFRRERL